MIEIWPQKHETNFVNHISTFDWKGLILHTSTRGLVLVKPRVWICSEKGWMNLCPISPFLHIKYNKTISFCSYLPSSLLLKLLVEKGIEKRTYWSTCSFHMHSLWYFIQISHWPSFLFIVDATHLVRQQKCNLKCIMSLISTRIVCL
jgi:hypothetical protein